jgi:MFS transporter, PHS family, inorganic phosphate transporter
MMASVFFMQPLGQISGNLVSLLVVLGSRNHNSNELIKVFDSMWRWVIGIGVIPGVIGLLFRMAIPETPRFLLDIEDDPVKAEFDATELFGGSSIDTESGESSAWRGSIQEPNALPLTGWPLPDTPTPTTVVASLPGPEKVTLNSHWTLSKADIIQYFWVEGNWRTLLATSVCWLLLDFGFYGIGLSSPQFLAKTWNTLNLTQPSPVWMTNDNPNASIYTMFMDTSVQALVILNIGSFAGGLLMIVFANRLNRVSLQKYGFLFLAALFVVLGTVFITIQKTGGVAIALYVIGQLAFNFGTFVPTSPRPCQRTEPLFTGPNATTYIIPAEIFPTRYRASCHGISAASGKLGSILVQIFSAYYKFGSSSPGKAQTKRYGTILIVFSAAMILGAVVTHFWIPDVQNKDKTSKTLEELATGRMGPRSGSVTRQRDVMRIDPGLY